MRSKRIVAFWKLHRSQRRTSRHGISAISIPNAGAGLASDIETAAREAAQFHEIYAGKLEGLAKQDPGATRRSPCGL